MDTTTDRITVDPAVMNGQACIRDMRIKVRRVLLALKIHPDWQELLRDYPDLEEEGNRQALDWAAGNLNYET